MRRLAFTTSGMTNVLANMESGGQGLVGLIELLLDSIQLVLDRGLSLGMLRQLLVQFAQLRGASRRIAGQRRVLDVGRRLLVVRDRLGASAALFGFVEQLCRRLVLLFAPQLRRLQNLGVD